MVIRAPRRSTCCERLVFLLFSSRLPACLSLRSRHGSLSSRTCHSDQTVQMFCDWTYFSGGCHAPFGLRLPVVRPDRKHGRQGHKKWRKHTRECGSKSDTAVAFLPLENCPDFYALCLCGRVVFPSTCTKTKLRDLPGARGDLHRAQGGLHRGPGAALRPRHPLPL